MQTVVKDNSGKREMSVEALMMSRRIVQLVGEVNDKMAVGFANAVAQLEHENPDEPIKVFINSDGGSVDAGLLIYDIIDTAKAPIDVYCLGKAYSMAAVIFASGKHSHRHMMPHSRLMIHEPLVASGVGGKTSSINTLASDMLRTKEQLAKILEKHTGQTAEKINDVMKDDTFFTAEEAVKFGLADDVMGFSEMNEVKAK